MKIFCHNDTLQRYLDLKRKKSQKIAFVPTMGALHDGHLTLVRSAKGHAEIVVCSIFVNPTQFNNNDDLDKYPRQEKKDAEMLKSVDCEVLFLPDVKEIYPSDFTAPIVDLGGIELVMEGANRPGHFEGVVEVVSRLFDIVKPDAALFGEKDFQQLAVIRRMTEELNYDIEILGVKIVREKNGLAMSSRNQRLSNKAKDQASFIFKTLTALAKNYEKNSPSEIRKLIERNFAATGFFELEYFELANNKSLKSVSDWNNPNGTRAFVVAWIEGVRLIDNMEIIQAER